ncbi:hypothetical protein BJX70DRAFT_367830 [Aspergillus crustosus]
MMAKAPWADTPFNLIAIPKITVKEGKPQSIFAASQKAITHNIYIRGLNAIYNQATGVSSPDDIEDFLTFCRIWMEVVQQDHILEEEVLIPGIRKDLGEEGIAIVDLSQTRVIDRAIKTFKDYIRMTKPAWYNGDVLQKLIDDFGTLLVDYLHTQIRRLLEIGRGFDPTGKALKKNYLVFEKRLVARRLWTRHHPIIFGCHDITFENGVTGKWPSDASVYIPYAISGALSKSLAGVWRFLPCDLHGRPRALSFTKVEYL